MTIFVSPSTFFVVNMVLVDLDYWEEAIEIRLLKNMYHGPGLGMIFALANEEEFTQGV